MNTPYRLSWREMQDFRRDQLATTLDLIKRLGPVAHVKMLHFDIHLICEPDVIRELLVKQTGELRPRCRSRDASSRP